MAETNQNEDEHFGDERRNLKEDDRISIVYGSTNTFPTYNTNNNKKRL